MLETCKLQLQTPIVSGDREGDELMIVRLQESGSMTREASAPIITTARAARDHEPSADQGRRRLLPPAALVHRVDRND
jgi:hypothetical protein